MTRPADKAWPQQCAAALAVLVAAMALLVLCGWPLGQRRLVAFFAGNAAMKFNQALALLLLAFALALLAWQSAVPARAWRHGRLIAFCAGAASLLIALITLGEHLGAPLIIDELLFVEPPADFITGSGRMSVSSALGMTFLATALLCVRPRGLGWLLVNQTLAVLGLLVGLLRLLSYSYGQSPFTRIGGWGMMGVHSAAALVLLGVALLLLQPKRGIASLFTGDHAGSLLARRLWLPLLGINLLFGCALEWSRFTTLYGYQATMALLSVVTAAGLSVAIGWTARALNLAAGRLVEQRQMYAVLSGINTAIARIRDREELFQEACRLLVADGGFASASVGLLDAGEDGLLRSAAGESPLRDRQPFFSRSGDSSLRELPVSIVARTGLPLMLAGDEEMLQAGASAPGTRRAGCEALHPLKIDDQVIGVLAVQSARTAKFHPEVLRLLAAISADLAFGVDFLNKEARLNFLAYHDALTGLPNSALFMERVTQKLAEPLNADEHVAVVVLDLDRFSQINDSLGRECGDALLQLTGRRLKRILQRGETVARLSADSFALTLRGTAEDITEQLSSRILGCLHEPFIVDRQIRVAARAGVALAPQDGTDANTLFANAEAALKHAQAVREPYRLYSPSINSSVARRVSMETRLRNAIDQHEFLLHFQPKFAASTRRVTGLEALLRWRDPEEGLVSPASFIPMLEDTGLIVQVGLQVVEMALTARRRWRQQGIMTPRIAINVSGVQFRRGDFVAGLRDCLARAGADGSCLEVEITESVLVKDDSELVISTLSELRAMGVTIAVDDFGTGYSSLQYLAELPIDKLKIDRSFVATMSERSQSAAIVATIISLAHTLKLSVVAEGVETPAQALALKALGCEELQGYLLGRPQDEATIGHVLRASLAESLLLPVPWPEASTRS